MKPMLTKAAQHPLYYYRNGMRIEGPHPGLLGNVSSLWGDVTGLWGDVTGLWGNVSGLRGNVTGLRGNVTGLRGDVSGLEGDLDACGITDAEREAGVDVATLVRTGTERAMTDYTKPCPFCGESDVGVKDGDTCRWRYAECDQCGARGPEVRVQTLGDGTAKEWAANARVRAVEAWNNRPEPPKDAECSPEGVP